MAPEILRSGEPLRKLSITTRNKKCIDDPVLRQILTTLQGGNPERETGIRLLAALVDGKGS